MSNTDYQSQLTQIYGKLVTIQESLVKLAPMSSVNTIQDSLQDQLDSLSSQLDALNSAVQSMQLIMSDLIVELRSK